MKTLAAAILAGSLFTSACGTGDLPGPAPGSILVAVGSDDGDAMLVRTLQSFGLEVATVSPARIAQQGWTRPVYFTLDAARALDAKEVAAVRESVVRGGSVAFEGRSKLAESIGVRFDGSSFTASGGRGNKRFDLVAHWKEPVRVPSFAVDAEGTFQSRTGKALQAEGKLGAGKFVFFAVPAVSKKGQVRIPGLQEVLATSLGTGEPALVRPTIEALYDPADRPDVSPRELAAMWRERGISAIHVADWRRTDDRALVEALHDAGLRAYLWLSWPNVEGSVWQSNEGCREMDQAGTPVDGAIALEDPGCMTWALGNLRSKLDAAPWDGVNVSGLGFDAGDRRGGNQYTPFHPWVRRDFASRRGFDPIELFNPDSARFHEKDPRSDQAFQAYRTALVTKMHRDVLTFLNERMGGRDIVVTIADDVLDANPTRTAGVDASAILKLRPKVRFRVAVTPPAAASSESAADYARMRRTWLKRDEAVTFGFSAGKRAVPNPTEQMAGAELSQTVSAVDRGRIAVGTEAQMPDGDWVHIQSSLANPVSIRPKGTGYEIETRRAAMFLGASWEWASVDGLTSRIAWQGRYLVPPGKHLLEPAAKPQGWRITWTSCDVLSVAMNQRQIRYTSPSPCHWKFVDRPDLARAIIDGKPLAAGALEDQKTEMLLTTPRGSHLLELP